MPCIEGVEEKQERRVKFDDRQIPMTDNSKIPQLNRKPGHACMTGLSKVVDGRGQGEREKVSADVLGSSAEGGHHENVTTRPSQGCVHDVM